MRLSLGPRSQAVLILALVATLGALLGILGDRLVAGQRMEARFAPGTNTQAPRGGPAARLRYSERLAERLNLSTEQRAQIDTILAEERLRARALTRQYQPQFRAIAEQTRERVEAVLTVEQREELRGMRQRMRRGGDARPGDRDQSRP